MRHDQLVGITLLFRERSAALKAFGRIWNCAIECSPSGAKAERCHHEPCVSENSLSLIQALAFHASDQAVGININVVEREGRGVAEANAVLVFRFIVSETFRVFLNNEPSWPCGCAGQDRVCASDSAVADPLLVAVNLVADDFAVFHDSIGSGAERPQIAARLWFRGAVGEKQDLISDAAQTGF